LKLSVLGDRYNQYQVVEGLKDDCRVRKGFYVGAGRG
jgi:hypothetical protein